MVCLWIGKVGSFSHSLSLSLHVCACFWLEQVPPDQPVFPPTLPFSSELVVMLRSGPVYWPATACRDRETRYNS